MAETPSKVPVKTGVKARTGTSAVGLWRPMESLRREVDRLFEDFDRDFWRFPFRRPASLLEPFRRVEEGLAPAVDIVDAEKAYEVTAELPGIRRQEHRSDAERRRLDHQRRETRREGGKGEELPS